MTTVNERFRLLSRAVLVALVLAAGLAAGPLPAADETSAYPPNDAVDMSALKAVPVYHQGRLKAYDSFARLATATITDREKGSLKLNLEEYLNEDESLEGSEYADALPLFPDGKTRKFSAAEAVLSWLVEPEKWEAAPFIYAPHEDLRELMNVRIENDRGERLNFVSPAQVARSEELLEFFRELNDRREAARSKEEDYKMTPTEERVDTLINRYTLYRALTLDPTAGLTYTPISVAGSRSMFMEALGGTLTLLNTRDSEEQTFQELLTLFIEFGQSRTELKELGQAAKATNEAIERVRYYGSLLYMQRRAVAEQNTPIDELETVPFDEVRDAILLTRKHSAELAKQMRQQKQEIFKDPQLKNLRNPFKKLAYQAQELDTMVLQMHVALYDEGNYSPPSVKQMLSSLLVLPSMNAPALSKNRDTEKDSQNKLQPWLSLQTVLYSDEMTADYPRGDIEAFRSAWHALKDAYTDRANPNREEDCIDAEQRMAKVLRRLGEEIEPVRRKWVKSVLPEDQFDEEMLTYTAYPSHSRMAREVHYNSIRPFDWSWLICAFAAGLFLLAFGRSHKAFFWAAVGVLALAITWSAYGFYLRVRITEWAPVTTMFETVIWVPFVVSVLGLGFLLLPIMWNGLKDSWRLNAIPGTWEAKPLSEKQQRRFAPQIWSSASFVCVPIRAALMGMILYILAISTGYGDGHESIISLLPRLQGHAGNMANDLLVWAVGLLCLGLAMWFLPRVALTLLAALILVPADVANREEREPAVRAVYARKWFGFSAAIVSTFFFCLASYVPVLDPKNQIMDPNFSPLMPVLRSNFWLSIHVVTIVSSYAAGMLAWGLGLAGLSYCVFGRYRTPVVHKTVGKGLKPAHPVDDEEIHLRRRPPEQSVTLANYAYRAIQVAVLLLAAGTILGGLWADVSWGRFWGWDPKEVWALISLLVYLFILHGRFAGWFNNFGLLFGTVFGFTAIAFSWYGVNFILPKMAKGGSVGLHSYGVGDGGVWYVIGFGALNLIYLGIATARYLAETNRSVAPEEQDDAPLAAQLVEH